MTTKKLPAGFEHYVEPIQYVNIAGSGVCFRNSPALWDRWAEVRGPEPSECIYALGSDHNWLATEVNKIVRYLPLLHPATSAPLFRRTQNGAMSEIALPPAPEIENFPPMPIPSMPTGVEHFVDTVPSPVDTPKRTVDTVPSPADTPKRSGEAESLTDDTGSSTSRQPRHGSRKKMTIKVDESADASTRDTSPSNTPFSPTVTSIGQ